MEISAQFRYQSAEELNKKSAAGECVQSCEEDQFQSDWKESLQTKLTDETLIMRSNSIIDQNSSPGDNELNDEQSMLRTAKTMMVVVGNRVTRQAPELEFKSAGLQAFEVFFSLLGGGVLLVGGVFFFVGGVCFFVGGVCFLLVCVCVFWCVCVCVFFLVVFFFLVFSFWCFFFWWCVFFGGGVFFFLVMVFFGGVFFGGVCVFWWCVCFFLVVCVFLVVFFFGGVFFLVVVFFFLVVVFFGGVCVFFFGGVFFFWWCVRVAHFPVVDWARILRRPPTASPVILGTGVLWVSTGTHPCGSPSRQDDGETRAPALHTLDDVLRFRGDEEYRAVLLHPSSTCSCLRSGRS